MREAIYGKKMENLNKEKAKIIYSERLNVYSFEFKGKKVTSEPLTPRYYGWMKQDIKFNCKLYNCKDSQEKIDPNIWFLIKKYEHTYGKIENRNLKLEYLNSMLNAQNYANIPFKALYSIESEKNNFFDLKRFNVHTNIKLQKKLQNDCSAEFLKIQKEKFRGSSNTKNKSFFKRTMAIVFATLAGLAVWGGNNSSKHENDINENVSNVSNFNRNNEFDESTETVTTKDINQFENLDIEKTKDKIENFDKNMETCSNIKQESTIDKNQQKDDEVKVGDKIKIVSDNAKYYIDSLGSGKEYSYNEFKEKYQIEEVYAEFIENGSIHGIGVTKDNEKIHFGWLEKGTSVEKVSDDEVDIER